MHTREHSKLPQTENHTKILRAFDRMGFPSLVIGFSCRALAQSVHRAGLEPWVIDCCGDLDTLDCSSRYQKINGLDNTLAIEECVSRWQSETEFCCVFLAGGMENQISLPILPSLGIPIVALPLLRAWQSWERWAWKVGLAFPETMVLQSDPSHSIADKLGSFHESENTWLVKDLSQAGGLGVRRLQPGLNERDSYSVAEEDRNTVVLQRHVRGDSLGVAFLSGSEGGVAIGAVQSLSHRHHPWSEFIYRGSIGPLPLTQDEWSRLDAFARCVTLETGWLGVWNADFIRASDGWYLLEINPRWSAGMELLDREKERSIAWHHAHAIGAIDNGESWNSQERLIEQMRLQSVAPIRKEILYLESPWKCTEQAVAAMWERRWVGRSVSSNSWSFGDIPPGRTELGAGYPFCSLFTEMENGKQNCERSMEAKQWMRREFQIPIAS